MFTPFGSVAELTPEFYSPGYLAQLFQESPARLRRVLEAAGLRPDHTTNGIDYWRGEVVDVLRQRLGSAGTTESTPLP